MNKQLLKLLSLLLFALLLCSIEASADDYSYQGTIKIKVGETIYIQLPTSIYSTAITGYYPQGKWVLSNNYDNAEIVSGWGTLQGCKVKGKKAGKNIKLTFSGNSVLYDMLWSFTGYYLIDVIEPCVSSISVSPSSTSLKVGETKQLSATVTPSSATNKSVSWSSENQSIATVSSNGLVTAKAAGSTTITCKANDDCGTQATCSVTVTAADPIKVTGITLNYTSASMVVNDTKKLSATISPSNATDKTVSWSSSDSDIASVDANGKVTANARGTAIITCKANDGSGVKATCDITVASVKPNTKFTAKTIEGVEMTFYSRNDGTCYVYGSPCIDKNTTGKITIPNEAEGLKVVEIGYNAFKDCIGITEVVVPTSVEKIEGYAFCECTALAKIALGNGVKSLGYSVFNGCTSLQTITGISQLEEIGSSAFNVTYDTFIPWYNNLPDGLLYLGKVLYKYKGTMPENTSVSVENGTKQVSKECFKNCSGLINLSIPESVSGIGSDAFSGCPNLSSIEIASGNTKYDSRNNCNAIIEKETNTVIVGCKNSTFPSTVKAIGSWAFEDSGITEVIIPNNIEGLAQSAFAFNNSLTSIVIGKGVKVMGDDSNPFLRNPNVTSIAVVSANPYYDSRNNCNAIIETSTGKLITGCSATIIPSTVKTIGTYAFASVKNSVYILDYVENIERDAFLYNSLHTVLIGKNIKEIEKDAFASCSKLQDIYSLAEDPIEIDESAFNNLYSGDKDATYNRATLHVPAGSMINYMTCVGWSKFKNITEFDPNTFDPSTLGIQNVTMDADKDAPVFDLFGRKLSQPRKGINIINGRKVIVK